MSPILAAFVGASLGGLACGLAGFGLGWMARGATDAPHSCDEIEAIT